MKSFIVCILLFGFYFVGCRTDDTIIPEEREFLLIQNVTGIKGFYLLNEGNMNMNKATLDYYDYSSGMYRRNVYGQANPNAVLGLGDVGNDIGIYGSKLYVLVNNSNKIEIMDAKTCKRLGIIDLQNCRYITFAAGKAYVSAYRGQAEMGTDSPNGVVVEIDTALLTIGRTIVVGRQPEELVVAAGKLYVANSGGYSPPNYERTVSVIDLNTFEVIKTIDVAPNLHRLKADRYGYVWVSSRGDNLEAPSNLYIIDTKDDTLIKAFDIACANFAISTDTAYIIGSEFSYSTFTETTSYSMIDVKNQTILEGSFLPQSIINEIKMPYGIAVDPISRNIYITDATDYVSPGKLYCIDKSGNVLIRAFRTGDIPAHIAFH
jgi:DNA-binding beta-propeller fold protein YncE